MLHVSQEPCNHEEVIKKKSFLVYSSKQVFIFLGKEGLFVKSRTNFNNARVLVLMAGQRYYLYYSTCYLNKHRFKHISILIPSAAK